MIAVVVRTTFVIIMAVEQTLPHKARSLYSWSNNAVINDKGKSKESQWQFTTNFVIKI